MIKAIFFDQDNTIFNSSEISSKAYEASFNYISNESGIDKKLIISKWKDNVSKLKHSTDPGKRSFEYSLTKTLTELNISKKYVDFAVKEFYKKLEELIELTNGTKKFFEQNINIIKILFTEDDSYQSDIKLNKFEFKKNFDMIITSTDMGIMKPNIKYLEKAWSEFSLNPEECIYIGDNWEKDCKIGQELGGIGVIFGKEDSRANYSIFSMIELSKKLEVS